MEEMPPNLFFLDQLLDAGKDLLEGEGLIKIITSNHAFFCTQVLPI